jgi:hypothetical protein
MKLLYFTKLLVMLNLLSCYSSAEDVHSEETIPIEKKIKSGEEFYEDKYENVCNSDKMKTFMLNALKEHKDLDMTEEQKIIFLLGFFRGINAYNSLKKFKDKPDQAKIHFDLRRKDTEFEMKGWLSGCKYGNQIGDEILLDFKKHLESL